MNTATGTRTRLGRQTKGRFPAYGPVDAALSFGLFYVVLTRLTPTVVAVTTDVLAVSASAVGLWLAGFLWFVLAMTILDQGRRQLGALGVGNDVVQHTTPYTTLSETQALGYLAVVLVGGVIAAWTFESGIAGMVLLIRAATTLEATGFDATAFFVLVVFFVSFGLAAMALDRLVVGGVRAMLAD